MKRGTPDHPKTQLLGFGLSLQKWGAVGVLECLWHFAALYALQGDVGRFTDEQIAGALGWPPADAPRLIRCLTDAGWLDRCRCHRLRIHDWPDHADQTVERVLTNRNEGFLACYDDPSTVLASSQDHPSQPLPLPLPVPSQEPLPIPRPSGATAPGGRRRPKKQEVSENDTPERRALIDAYNAVLSAPGKQIGYTPGNLKAAGRALAEGYTLEHCKTVFEAVKAGATIQARWCKENNREFEYLVRPPYKHHRTGEVVQGPLDKIHNELATGRKAS